MVNLCWKQSEIIDVLIDRSPFPKQNPLSTRLRDMHSKTLTYSSPFPFTLSEISSPSSSCSIGPVTYPWGQIEIVLYPRIQIDRLPIALPFQRNQTLECPDLYPPRSDLARKTQTSNEMLCVVAGCDRSIIMGKASYRHKFDRLTGGTLTRHVNRKTYCNIISFTIATFYKRVFYDPLLDHPRLQHHVLYPFIYICL